MQRCADADDKVLGLCDGLTGNGDNTLIQGSAKTHRAVNRSKGTAWAIINEKLAQYQKNR